MKFFALPGTVCKVFNARVYLSPLMLSTESQREVLTPLLVLLHHPLDAIWATVSSRFTAWSPGRAVVLNAVYTATAV